MSIIHLVNPSIGEKLRPVNCSELFIDGQPLVKDLSFNTAGKNITGVTLIGDEGNICASILYKGALVEGTEANVTCYQSVSGAGTKSVYLTGLDGTVYYRFIGLVNPDAVVTMEQLAPLPNAATPLFLRVTNDGAGIIKIIGLNINF